MEYIHFRVKTFEVESLFLWAFVLALERRMTTAAFAFLFVVLYYTVDVYRYKTIVSI